MKKLINDIRFLIAGLFFGLGLSMGFLPILIASIIAGDNLYNEIIERMDQYWRIKIN